MSNIGSITSTNGRITRRQYAILLAAYVFMLVMAVLIAKVLAAVGGMIGMAAWGVMIMGAVRRSHDCGRSGWFLLIPFYNIWLFFEPGNRGPNKFGPDPRASGDVGESGAR